MWRVRSAPPPTYEDMQLDYLIDYSPPYYSNVYNTTFATSSVFPEHPFWYFRRSFEFLENIGNGTISELGYFDVSNNMLAVHWLKITREPQHHLLNQIYKFYRWSGNLGSIYPK